MHVVMITQSFFEYTVQLANALSKQDGVKVTWIMPSDYNTITLPESWSSLIGAEVEVKLFRYRNWKKDIGCIKSFFRMIKYLRQIKPDVIHFQESPNPIIYFIFPFINIYPLVSTLHEPKSPRFPGTFHPILRFIRDLFVKIIIVRYSDKIIVHGDHLKRLATSRFNIEKENIHIIPHGEFSIFTRWSGKDVEVKPNYILFFGKIYERKGLEYLIRAEPLIRHEFPSLKIIIAGEGNLSKYERIMQTKSTFEIYNKFISHEEVSELFQRASVVVLPYIDASQSGIVPIAYAFKKPVVVTNVGSIPEVVDDGKTGFIVPPRDSKALADAIIKLLKNDKLRKEMGEHAYKKMKEELSWDKIAKKTIEVYKEAIRDKTCK